MGQAGPVMGSFLEQLSPQQSVCFSESAFPTPLATCCLAEELHRLVVWLQSSDGGKGYGSLLKKEKTLNWLKLERRKKLQMLGNEDGRRHLEDIHKVDSCRWQISLLPAATSWALKYTFYVPLAALYVTMRHCLVLLCIITQPMTQFQNRHYTRRTTASM